MIISIFKPVLHQDFRGEGDWVEIFAPNPTLELIIIQWAAMSYTYKSSFYQLVIRINRSNLYDCVLFNTQTIMVNTNKGTDK